MKLADIDKVNHLVTGLEDIRALIHRAETAELSMFELFIEAGGDSSLKMSQEGASTSHSGGISVSDGFLKKLRELALAELQEKRDAILTDLIALGVDTAET
jgi:hypothetical protein